MAKASSKKKLVKTLPAAKKQRARPKKTRTPDNGDSADETASTIDAETLEQLKAAALSQVEEITEGLLEDKISAGVKSEIKHLKKEVVDEVMGTIMPLLEALKKIADEAPQASGAGNADWRTTADAMGTAVPSLQEMQKAAIETIRTQEKLMTGSENILEELEKARKLFAKTRKRGIKGYWLEQLVKNSSGEKGGSDK